MRYLLLLALAVPAAAQTPPQPARPGSQETITVHGEHLVQAPVPTVRRPPPPGVMPQDSDAARGFQGGVRPHAYCGSAYTNDVSGQPGTALSLNGRCPQ